MLKNLMNKNEILYQIFEGDQPYTYLRKNRSYGLVCFPKDVGHILDLVRRTHNSSKVFGFRAYSAYCLLNCDFIRIEDGCLWKIRSFNHFERENVNLYGGHAICRLETRGIKC
jgi:hypothetical protein